MENEVREEEANSFPGSDPEVTRPRRVFYQSVGGGLSEEIRLSFQLANTPYTLKPPLLGQGSYGICCCAYSKPRGEDVAIKRIEIEGLHIRELTRILREIRLLRKLEHENIVKIYDVFSISSVLYLVLKKSDTDLRSVILSGQKVALPQIRFISYQLLKAIKFLHSADFLHRDLKPENILISSDCHIEVCDFGLATYDQRNGMSEYVQTRYYRAPEVLMTGGPYGKEIDLWSVGCVIGELILGRPLFRGGDYMAQMRSIVRVLGNPSEKEILAIASSSLSVSFFSNLPDNPGVGLRSMFQQSSEIFGDYFEDVMDLLEHLLIINPSGRYSVEQALDHQLFRDFTDARLAPCCVPELKKSLQSVRKSCRSKKTWRNEILKEILFYHPELMSEEYFSCFQETDIALVDLQVDLASEKRETRENIMRQRRHNLLLRQSGATTRRRRIPLLASDGHTRRMKPPTCRTE